MAIDTQSVSLYGSGVTVLANLVTGAEVGAWVETEIPGLIADIKGVM